MMLPLTLQCLKYRFDVPTIKKISCPVHIIDVYSEEVFPCEHLPPCFTNERGWYEFPRPHDGNHVQFIHVYIVIVYIHTHIVYVQFVIIHICMYVHVSLFILTVKYVGHKLNKMFWDYDHTINRLHK